MLYIDQVNNNCGSICLQGGYRYGYGCKATCLKKGHLDDDDKKLGRYWTSPNGNQAMLYSVTLESSPPQYVYWMVYVDGKSGVRSSPNDINFNFAVGWFKNNQMAVPGVVDRLQRGIPYDQILIEDFNKCLSLGKDRKTCFENLR